MFSFFVLKMASCPCQDFRVLEMGSEVLHVQRKGSCFVEGFPKVLPKQSARRWLLEGLDEMWSLHITFTCWPESCSLITQFLRSVFIGKQI